MNNICLLEIPHLADSIKVKIPPSGSSICRTSERDEVSCPSRVQRSLHREKFSLTGWVESDCTDKQDETWMKEY